MPSAALRSLKPFCLTVIKAVSPPAYHFTAVLFFLIINLSQSSLIFLVFLQLMYSLFNFFYVFGLFNRTVYPSAPWSLGCVTSMHVLVRVYLTPGLLL